MSDFECDPLDDSAELHVDCEEELGSTAGVVAELGVLGSGAIVTEMAATGTWSAFCSVSLATQSQVKSQRTHSSSFWEPDAMERPRW